MSYHPTKTPAQPDFIALVQRMKQRGLVKALPPAPVHVRVQKLPATRAVQQPKARRKPICRWCGSLHPAGGAGNCTRCGKPVQAAPGFRTRDFLSISPARRGAPQQKPAIRANS